MNNVKYFFFVGIVMLLVGCAISSTKETGLINYGETTQPWLLKLQRVKQEKQGVFRIVQFGDSHTAADFFTSQLRKRLQAYWGNAGIGWIYPNRVKGQRIDGVIYRGKGWQTMTSRKEKTDFPLGGVTAFSQGKEAVTIEITKAAKTAYHATFSLYPLLTHSPLQITDAMGKSAYFNPDSNQWHYFSLDVTLPLTYQTNANDLWQIGLINLETGHSGITLSALGLNGGRFSEWKKWRKDWALDLKQMNADLIILAYGTNEAFDEQLDLAKTEQMWRQQIKEIRKALPNAGILILGAPNALDKGLGHCEQPKQLDRMQALQKKIAQSEKLFYWSLQESMGGQCSMQQWQKMGLARSDGIHFTPQGYQKLADSLAKQLINLGQ
ncbi:GDSL-type esterase/lipase family protein [Avibacterium paragallinarum]|uniref:GDSL-type esterase/lipase family protein n=1 Tax=Avibacterium paragallinarum TaxID=728 RepID=UPI0021F73291|nr:GDSL-type esterase/lipase family protein [Avibacterium paragallinarum]UXN33862.1 GDSL-type esterase/lipase family protein [Avibacterium paragallinarum]